MLLLIFTKILINIALVLNEFSITRAIAMHLATFSVDITILLLENHKTVILCLADKVSDNK